MFEKTIKYLHFVMFQVKREIHLIENSLKITYFSHFRHFSRKRFCQFNNLSEICSVLEQLKAGKVENGALTAMVNTHDRASRKNRKKYYY